MTLARLVVADFGMHSDFNMKAKQKIDWRIVVTAMLCVTILELYALKQGHNGLILLSVIGGLLLAAGIMIPTPQLFRKD